MKRVSEREMEKIKEEPSWGFQRIDKRPKSETWQQHSTEPVRLYKTETDRKTAKTHAIIALFLISAIHYFGARVIIGFILWYWVFFHYYILLLCWDVKKLQITGLLGACLKLRTVRFTPECSAILFTFNNLGMFLSFRYGDCAVTHIQLAAHQCL